MSAVPGYSVEESGRRLTQSRSKVWEVLLQDFLGYDTIRREVSYVEKAIASFAGLDK